jgi:hypothetical protein
VKMRREPREHELEAGIFRLPAVIDESISDGVFGDGTHDSRLN